MAKQKRILVADDDEEIPVLLQTTLSELGHEVRTVANGQAALQAALAERFDLVLLDVTMPLIDGYHVAHEIITRLGKQAPYIIIMTGRDTEREKGIALMAGAHEVIQKPFVLAQLLERVKAALSKTH